MNGKIDFEEIYEKFQPKILGYLTRLVGSHEAEDVSQEVFERVRRGLDGFRGESKLSTWLYRIATNTAYDRLKTTKIDLLPEGFPPEESAEAEDKDVWTGRKKTALEQELVRKEMNECIRNYIEELPPDYKSVVLLSELEGFKNREIADILQVSLDTVKIRLHRARAGLKKKLEANCDFYQNEENELACDQRTAIDD